MSLAASLAMTFLLAACAGGPAPVDHFYRVEVSAETTTSEATLPGTLHIDPLRTDGLIGQRQLLYRKEADSAEIRQHGYHRWTDPPAIALQTALVSFLRDAHAAEIVMAANTQTRPDYRVSGRIHRFERVLSEAAVVVEIDLTLTTTKGDVLVHKSYAERHDAADVAAAAGAIGEAVRSIFERFLVDLGRAAQAVSKDAQPRT
jgi:ABC-type uncharacterized transport system auxiliary subunit